MLGGSAVSLLYTLQGLDRSRYKPIVGLIHPSEALIRHYADQGIETIACPGIITFEHTALGWTALHRPLTWPIAVRTATSWKESERRTIALVEAVKPDLVHLNSAVLLPSANALYRRKVPFIWHVREGACHGHVGLRYACMRRAMLRWPTEIIFLSEAERSEWTGGTRGRVVPNFVDFKRFDRSLDGKQIRREFALDEEAPVVLYLGGTNLVKGIFPLLQALALVKKEEPRVVCLMPGSVHKPSRRWSARIARAVLPHVGWGTHGQRIDQAIRCLGLEKTCVRTGFISQVERLIAACDLVVFPAITNHFARPVIEAAAMAKSVVVSRFPILEELVKHEDTGLLVPPGESVPLANAILALLRDREKRCALGERGYAIARSRYDAAVNTQSIIRIYEEVLENKLLAN